MEETDLNNGTSSTTTTTMIKFESEDFVEDDNCKSSPPDVQLNQLRLLQLATATAIIPVDHSSPSISICTTTQAADSSNNFKLEPDHDHHSFTDLMSSSPSIHSSLSCERISVSIPTTSAGGGGGVGHHQDLCEFSSDLDYAFGAASAAADLPSSSTTATSAESNLNHHCQDQDDFQENNNPAHRSSSNHHSRRRRSRPQTLKRRSSSSSSNGGTGSSSRPRIKKQITHEELMAQRNQANIRERQRTQSLNEAFNSLRTSIPTMPSDKMSKIQTLKLASDYIDFLYTVLRTNEQNPRIEISAATTDHHHNNATEIARASSSARARDRDTLGMAFNMWRMQDVWNGKQDMDFIHNNPELI